MTAAIDPRAVSTVQPRSDARGGNAPRNFFHRLRAARDAFVDDTPAAAANPSGIVAWAHGEIVGATFSRLADNDDGWRIAIQCGLIHNPMLQPTPESRVELERRIRKAWPELEANEVRRVMAHVDARAQAVLFSPSRRPDQVEHNKARRSWVTGWAYDQHDAEAAR